MRGSYTQEICLMQRLVWIALTIEGFNEADMYT